MSDGMERDKAEMLTSKERKEQEKMKQELQDMKMYETWYTYTDMKQVLGFINESKDMANMANDEKNAQKELSQSSNDSASEAMPKTNLAQELEVQEHSNTSRSLHLHRPRHSSPILDRISTHSRGSPEPAPATVDSRNSAYRNKNLDSDGLVDRLHDNLDIRDSYSHNTNRYISLKSKNTSQDSHGMHGTETMMDMHPERDQKLERWQINPLDSCVSENDVPLQQPDRPLAQDRTPFRLCKEAKTPEMLEKLLHTLNNHLKETAELWYSWHRTTDTKFQWGSPIQVGLAKGSSDKKSLTYVKTEENQTECTNKCSNERPNKRKSAMALSYSDTRHSSSDEDERVFKKKKIQSYEGSSRILRSRKEVVVTRDEKDQGSHDENISEDVEVAETMNLEVTREREECLSPELSMYSVKMPPPNARRNINKKKHNINTPAKSSSIHDSDEEQSAISLLPKGRTSALTDQEILIELEDDSNSDTIKGKSESTEIKPLPVKGLSRRIKNQCMLLEKIQMDKQKKMETEKEETQRKENEEKKKREEFYKKQTEERQEKNKQWEERQKSSEEKSKKWSNIMDTKFRKKINDEGREKLQGLREQNENTILEDTEEDRLFQDNSAVVTKRMKIVRNDLTNNVNCPICNQPFPSEQIEEHAAGCEQYITDDEDESNDNLFGNKITPVNANNDEALECGVCSVYRTTNGNHYEAHVNKCLQEHRQEESPDECATTDIDNILDSPIRCFRPISEQTDSDIDYRSQFPSNSRTQKHSSKKRRR